MVCDRGHAYEPTDDGAQTLVSGTEPTPAPESRRVPVGRSYSTTASALKMPFGKFKGEPIEDLPTDYIEWALRELDSLRPAIKEEMEAQLEMRGGRGVLRPRR